LCAIHGNLAPGDFIWTRDEDANFYLGRIAGGWRYVAEKDNIKADLFNLWNCDWTGPLTLSQVPGSLMLCRGSYRELKSKDWERIREYTKMLYANMHGEQYRGSRLEGSSDLFSWISYSSCEDLVALYLQQQGYSIIPSTSKNSTAKYEFELIHRHNGSVAAVQVKNGKTPLDCLHYASAPFKVYLFTSEGPYLNSDPCPENVEILDGPKLIKFAQVRRRSLPDTIRLWVDYLSPNTNV
jgi:hypothetical protein